MVFVLVATPGHVGAAKVPFSEQPVAPFLPAVPLSFVVYSPHGKGTCPDRFVDIHSALYNACDGAFDVRTGTLEDARKAKSPAWGRFADEIDSNGWVRPCDATMLF